MTRDIINKGGYKILKICGRLDTLSAVDFECSIQPLLAEKGLDLHIDCSEMTYISSSGLRCFIILQKSVSANSGILVIESLSSEIRDVFEMTGFDKIFTIKAGQDVFPEE